MNQVHAVAPSAALEIDAMTSSPDAEELRHGSLSLITEAVEKALQQEGIDEEDEEDEDGEEEEEEEEDVEADDESEEEDEDEDEEEVAPLERRNVEEDPSEDTPASSPQVIAEAKSCTRVSSRDPNYEDAGAASPSSTSPEEYLEVDLSEIRKDVQCPICLGIIRKTRTVMECLHRFCRECIDKSMRLGNNECPVCRTHCASRRSLRDDLNFDALIAALYRDVDRYEEEEFALREENKSQNQKLQERIAATLEIQSDAVTKRTTTSRGMTTQFSRRHRSRNPDHQIRNTSQSRFSNDEEMLEVDEHIVVSDTMRERRSRRRKRESVTFHQDSTDHDDAEKDDVNMQGNQSGAKAHKETKEMTSTSNAGKWEGLMSWVRAGTRSSLRQGNNNNSNKKAITRAALLLEALSAAAQLESKIEFNIHVALKPFKHDNGHEDLPSLEKPHICCPANVTIQNLCEFLVRRLPIESKEHLELMLGNDDDQDHRYIDGKPKQKGGQERVEQILNPVASLGQIHELLWQCQGNMVLFYRRKSTI